MNIQKLAPQTKKIITLFALVFCVLCLTNMTFANSEASKTDISKKTNPKNTDTAAKPLNEVTQKLTNTQANGKSANFVQETNTKLHSDFTSNLFPNTSSNQNNFNGYTSNSSGHIINNYPNSQTQIYGGSSTIISGNSITTSNSQQNGYPQHQIINNQQHNSQQSSSQPNQGMNNHNSNAGGFYFNMTGPNGSSMSMGTFFGSNSSNNSTARESTSQILSGNGSQSPSSQAPLRGSNIISE